MSAADNLQTVKNIYEAFNRGDIDAILASCAEDVEWGVDVGTGELPWAGVRHGHAGARQFFDLVAEHLEVDLVELDFPASENQVAAVNRQELTLKKNGQKVICPEVVNLWTIGATGKVTRLSTIMDPTQLLAAWRQ